MDSMPANSARYAPKNTITRTKIYCEILSCTRLKNQRPIIGNTMITNRTNTTMETDNCAQKCSVICPVAMPTITVNTKRANISVIIVPPTVIDTDLSLLIPNLLMMG